MVTFVWKLQPRAGQFFEGSLGGLMRGFCPPRQARCGPRAEGAHVCAPQQAAFISKHFHWFFGRDRYSSNNWGALDSGGLNSNYRMSDAQKKKIYLNSGKEIRR